MAFTITAGPVDNLSASGSSVSVNITLTAGNSLIVGARWHFDSPEITSITCTGESDLTLHGTSTYDASTTESLQFASLPIVASSGAKTVTVNFSGVPDYTFVVALEVSGGDTADFFDAENSTAGSSTNPTGSVTTSLDGAFIFAMVAALNSASDAGAGFTEYPLSAGVYNAGDTTEYDLSAGAAGVISVPFVNPFNGGWLVKAAAFNISAAGVSTFNLPVITLSASGGALGAAFNLPMLTLAAGNEGAEFDLPMLTLVAAGTTAAQFNLPMLTVTGEGGPLSTYTVEATAPSPTGSATLLTGRALTFENTAPAPTGTSTLISGNALTFEGTAPAPELEMNMKGLWIIAPAPELEATLLTGRVLTFTGTAPAPELESSTLDVLVGRTLTFAGTAPAPQLKMDMKGLWITAPAPELEATLLAGSALTFTGTAPSPELEMSMKGLWITAPAPELEATLVTGGVISAVIRAPSPVLVATLSNSLIITAENSAPAPTLVATLATGNILTMALTAREPRLTANILTGEVLTAELTAASPIMEAYGYPAYILTASMVAPAPYLNAFLTTAVGATYRTWALNTRKLGLTEYDWTFNSYCVFNGKTLACNSNGVVELGTELLDNATTIPWRWRTGEHGYGTSLLKRVPRVYVDGSATGDMFFRVITPEQGTRSYLLPYLHVVGTTQRRVPIGKGIKGKRFQFECENSGDTNFSTNEVIVYPVKLKRRVM